MFKTITPCTITTVTDKESLPNIPVGTFQVIGVNE